MRLCNVIILGPIGNWWLCVL